MAGVKRLQPLSFEEFEALEQQERYTYELIDDTAYIWPTPSIEHQRIRGKVYQLTIFPTSRKWSSK